MSQESRPGLLNGEYERIRRCFCDFIEGSLITHDIDKVLCLFAEDVMGIGMGAQGIVRGREDMRPILMNTRSDVDDTQTSIDYSNLQIRYYGDDYASICATIAITTTARGQRHKSHIGQCASMRRLAGEWKINMVQATPLSIGIQEIDAYPLSFAEDNIEKYRMQEQFSNVMQRNMIATYKIDFDSGEFEDYTPIENYSFPVSRGDLYESKLIQSANDMLDKEERLKFLETFSLASLSRQYRAGQTDVALDYESTMPDGRRLWLQSSIHLFTDIQGRLKGYLYLFNIDQRKRKELALTRQAELDLATAVYNKETARQKIQLAMDLYPRMGTGAFFMIDLDRFKQINDTYGHAEGERVVRQTAEILKSLFRKEDIVGRLGGDEFCVFFTGQNRAPYLARKAEQICQAVRAIHPAQDGAPGTSASIGIAGRTGGETFDELYRRADRALYIQKSKHAGGGFTIDLGEVPPEF